MHGETVKHTTVWIHILVTDGSYSMKRVLQLWCAVLRSTVLRITPSYFDTTLNY